MKADPLEYLEYEDIRYARYRDKEGEISRGTAILFDDRNNRRMVNDYPHIFRVYRLREGIKRFFGNDWFYAEEKLDGYNVRILKHDSRIIAVTRGGIICPFSTEWVHHWMGKYRIDDFFEMYPDRILCAEFLGDNPYNSKHDPTLPAGMSFFCFDIMMPSGKLMHPEERYSILNDLKLPQVHSFGKFRIKDFGRIKDIVKRLNDNKREGIIFKKVSGDKAIKFVTAESDLIDIEQFIPYFYDIEPGFYSNRLMRISLFTREFGLDEEEYSRKLGKAILNGYSPLEKYEGSFENFTIYMHSLENWKMLKKIILTHIDIIHDEIEERELGGVMLFKIKFSRKHKKSTLRYREIISGHEE